MLRTVTPSKVDWSASPTGAPGCFGKKLFRYGSEQLGQDGRARDYTTLYRFDPGARYPTWRIEDGGACEIWVVEGTLEVNGEKVEKDEWVQLLANPDGWALASIAGCQLLAIVRGRIELLESMTDL